MDIQATKIELVKKIFEVKKEINVVRVFDIRQSSNKLET